MSNCIVARLIYGQPFVVVVFVRIWGGGEKFGA